MWHLTIFALSVSLVYADTYDYEPIWANNTPYIPRYNTNTDVEVCVCVCVCVIVHDWYTVVKV